ncbi:helix-turn-helix transcriptional regulator [Caldimonas thermodepolymerans]|jgi:transcriptional regulator with XRE-family HTH domain|uniref:Helix-turn-helix protein n=1 Tax=Caldimonas thermodepolymerans TaxID=215580 RepID=A0A2S5T4I3_9BURK|nr:helix-turn-helix transcriptional regulator [Caldimonas thermodepolymerans]PPE69891.1 hypothetical protein C1702_08435 [Caldimonas thermodepolymerans]QPC31621.1 helix-turn-helix transcriptional regulator [Caldimonas thermodepolymerans]RDH94789.1 helix-turn-helix protein [Caldimonas thermodepolymerans]TCP02439.1 helix-turn-helix protein [Caldimonas thermodepolymerans]UZG48038.1 helix-turn-helix transcriptional regulator [Caldimonas thermodepolymerans]
MRTLSDIASRLRQQAKQMKVTQEELRRRSGISRQTLTNMLNGHTDYRVNTLLAVADRLGLELVLVPKVSAPALEAGPPRPSVVKTRVRAALEGQRTLHAPRPRTVTGAPGPEDAMSPKAPKKR